MMIMNFDAQKFLNQPHYATDFSDSISGVLDFLDFSERNIDWQLRSERGSLQREKETGSMSIEYYDNVCESIEQRFTVSLPIRIRYSALVALATAVDWSVEFLTKNKRVDLRIPKTSGRTNRGLHVLRFFSAKACLAVDGVLGHYEN